MHEYYCITKQGKWKFFADEDIDAVRVALFYCWRDGEDFIKVERNGMTLRICSIDRNNSIQTL